MSGQCVGPLLGWLLLANELYSVQELLLLVIQEGGSLKDLERLEGLITTSLVQPDLIVVGDLEMVGIFHAGLNVIKGVLHGKCTITGCCTQLVDHLEDLEGTSKV